MILIFHLPWVRGIPSGIVNTTEFLHVLTSVIVNLTKRTPHNIQPNVSPRLLFEMIMAFCYKTKEVTSHRNRRHKEDQLSITLCRRSFSKRRKRSNVIILRSLKKIYATSFLQCPSYFTLLSAAKYTDFENGKDNFTIERYLLERFEKEI